MPDRVTGEPRPPAAPRGESRATEVTPIGRVPGSHPPSPKHLGPVLESSLPKRKPRIQASLALMAIEIVFATAVNGFQWMGLWLPWAFVVASGLFMYWRIGGEWFAAGAVWAQAGKSWVNTYELVEVKFSVDGLNRVLRLKDSSGQQDLLISSA